MYENWWETIPSWTNDGEAALSEIAGPSWRDATLLKDLFIAFDKDMLITPENRAGSIKDLAMVNTNIGIIGEKKRRRG